ncbi:hypothetical protein [Edaphobacter modestus]|uniref:hypothetical protein n=1 Tax=Edaphobacter modestus TaxID=388466 RepID=UPI00102BD706|nr:hypothetical protein [Edaphobacter modestus]
MSHPRQRVLLWEIPPKPELPQAAEQRCLELLSHMLLAAATNIAANNKEKSDEREDSVESH